MSPTEKLWFCLLTEIKKVPSSKLSDKVSNRYDVNKQIQSILKRTVSDTGRSAQEVTNAAHDMDQFNAHFIRADVNVRGYWRLPPDGKLLYINGDDFIYKMKKKLQQHKSTNTGINIRTLETNNANVGNYNKNNYINTNIHNINITSDINTLKKCGNKMSNDDKDILNNLCKLLKVDYNKPVKQGSLAKFKPFVKRTWKIIGTSLSTILIKLGLKHLGL